MNEIDMMIQNTVESELDEIKGMSLEGLCIYLANNIHFELENQGIKSEIFSIDEYSNTNYHHVFVVAKNESNKNIYLIDPSYSQFLPQKNQKLIAFDKWPTEVLKETKNGQILLNNLLKNGYSLVTNDDIKIYLNSFTSTKNLDSKKNK